MDTKLKNRYNPLVKTFAVLLFTAGLLLGLWGVSRLPEQDLTLSKDYLHSHALQEDLWEIDNAVWYLAQGSRYTSAQLTESERQNLADRLAEEYGVSYILEALEAKMPLDDFWVVAEDAQGNRYSGIEADRPEEYGEIISVSLVYGTTPYEQVQAYEEGLGWEIQNEEASRQEIIDNADWYAVYLQSFVDQGVYYRYRLGDQEGSSGDRLSDTALAQMPVYMSSDQDGAIQLTSDGMQTTVASYYGMSPLDSLEIAFSQAFVQDRQSEQAENYTATVQIIVFVGAGLLLCLASFIYLCCAAGRRPEGGEVKTLGIDRWYTELHLAVLVVLVVFFLWAQMDLYEKYAVYWSKTATLTIFLVLNVLIGLLALGVVLSLVRKGKAHRLVSDLAVVRLVCFLQVQWRKIMAMQKFSRRLVIVSLILGVILIITGWLFPLNVVFVVLIWILVFRQGRQFDKIVEGTQKIRDGDLDHKIESVAAGPLGDLAADINTIGDGLQTAVQREIRSERMKSELITNVSHDLRTPLTSIITYTDLLQKEGLSGPNAEKYLDVIANQAQRLKNLTEDLFEVSKSASGNMEVHWESLDLADLIRQGMGELDDKIQAAQLDFRLHFSAEPIQVYADGKLLWRIMDNLISNALKYAMPGSRVYIDVEDGEKAATVTMKNVSAYELNIPAEELTERFKRGEASRTSEGNGLGLAIAKNLAELMHGSFQVEIDGDLFKVSFTVPKE